jgi:hypothetical protein
MVHGNPMRNPAGYSSVAVMAVGLVLVAISYFSSGRALGIAGVIALFLGICTFIITFVTHRDRSQS